MLYHIAVFVKLPCGSVIIRTQESAAVPDFYSLSVGVDKRADDWLCAFFHLPDFRLDGAVGPYCAIGAGSDAVGEVFSALDLFLKIEVQECILRCLLFCGQCFVEYAYVVHPCVAYMHIGILSVRLCIAAHIDRERGIDKTSGSLSLCYNPVVDAEGHLVAIVLSLNMVPVQFPVGRQFSFNGVFMVFGTSRSGRPVGVDIESEFVLAGLLYAELPGAFGDE